MRNLGRAMMAIARVMDGLEPEEQAEIVRLMAASYGRPMTDAERASRYRSRHAGVTESSNGRHDAVTGQRDETVTEGRDAPLLLGSFLSSTPSTTGAKTVPAHDPPKPIFAIPASILTALEKCPHLLAVGQANTTLRQPKFWQTQIRANVGVDFARQLLEAEAWTVANPIKAPKSNVPAFLNRWFGRAAERARG